MSKRLFQVLDEMNVNDDVNKTATCACCFDLVGANKVKQGGHVTMGVPTEAVLKLLLGEYLPMLVLLDKKEYHRLGDQPVAKSEAERLAERYEKALKAISNPIAYLQQKAEEEGASLNGHFAQELARSAAFLQSLADEALAPKTTTDDTVNG